MSKIHIIILLILPYYLISQEQVSDIKYFGVYQPTNLYGKVGFALINGNQYMLKENDSLIIYNMENGSFIPQRTIKSFKNKIYSKPKGIRNRSLFSIKGDFYYRFYQDGFQIIDIAKGIVSKEFDFSSEGQINIDEFALGEERMYLELRQNGKQEKRLVDLSAGNFEIIDLPAGRNYYSQLGDLIPGLKESKKLYIYNAYTKVDSLVYESQTGIKNVLNSISDSSIVIIEYNGAITKVDKNLNLISTNCLVGNVLNLNGIHVNGSKIVAIYPTFSLHDSIVVLNIENCNLDLAFYVDKKDVFANNLSFIENEGHQNDFTIFGYSGFNPNDGFSKGRFYIINHITNQATEIENISSVLQNTAFIKDGKIYCVGVNQGGWNSNSYIIRQDILTSTILKLDPNNNYSATNVILGFDDSADNLYFITNTKQESPTLWTVSLNNIFTKKDFLDFRKNIGVNNIQNSFTTTKAIYFTNSTGLFSVFDDCQLKIPFINIPTILGTTEKVITVSNYDNKIAFGEIEGSKTVFKIFETSNNTIDSLELHDEIKSILLEVGPFIFFRSNNSNNPLAFFDIRNKKISYIHGLIYIDNSRLTRNKNSAVYYSTASNPSQKNKAYIIDFNIPDVKLLDIEFQDRGDVVPGFDDSFYFIDTKSNSNKTRIRLMKKNGEITEIYNGDGSFNYTVKHVFTPEKNTTFIILNGSNDKLHCISHDEKSTYQFTLNNLNIYNKDILAKSFQDNYILKTKDIQGDHYWYYKSFLPLIKIEDPNIDMMIFSELTYSLAILAFQKQDFTISIIKYDYHQNTKTTISINDFKCGLNSSVPRIFLNRNKILLTTSCNFGYEPYILDISNGTFQLLSDINPGPSSSAPRDFIKFKDWVYFTATIADNSRQWFRLASGEHTTSNLEVISYEPKILTIYPSPCTAFIKLDSDLDQFYIYNSSGQLVFSGENYHLNSPVSIEKLENGAYFLKAINKNSELMIGKFMKVD